MICRIAMQDLEAFEALYRRYASAVFGVALKWLEDCDRAEDALRRAFAAIWKSAVCYLDEPSDGARWVFTITRTAILGRTSAWTRARAVAQGWQAFKVHAAVAALPEHERVPLERAYWSGSRPVEIARELGLPQPTFEARVRGALARVAARLDDLG